jgi:putative flippase GtrA
MQVIRNLKNIDVISEFIRYFLVGGSAFLVDTGVLCLTKRFIFFNLGNPGILFATALGLWQDWSITIFCRSFLYLKMPKIR